MYSYLGLLYEYEIGDSKVLSRDFDSPVPTVTRK